MRLPWYDQLERIVAPTEKVSTAILIALTVITVLVIWKGSAVVKAGWLVYWVSP